MIFLLSGPIRGIISISVAGILLNQFTTVAKFSCYIIDTLGTHIYAQRTQHSMTVAYGFCSIDRGICTELRKVSLFFSESSAIQGLGAFYTFLRCRTNISIR